MKKICFVLISVILINGCAGSFELTKRVYNFHHKIDNKWAEEALFLACLWLPVYSVAVLGDMIIVNTEEFWQGENPMKPAPERKIWIEDDGRTEK